MPAIPRTVRPAVAGGTVRPAGGYAAFTDRRWNTGFVTVCVAAAFAYFIAPPHVPDLAAQVARADAARSGAVLWWTGWFGGLQLPSYSPLSPLVMSYVGVAASAAIAAVSASVCALWLFRGTRRPRLGATVFGICVYTDIVGGRVTFALGFAAATIALSLLRFRRPMLAAVATLVTVLLSPLAGLFLGLCAIAVLIADPVRRRSAAAICVLLAVAGASLAVLFRDTGTMGFPLWHLLVGLLILGIVAGVCSSRPIRVGALVVAAACIFFYLDPGAVGTNMVRLIWLAAPAVMAATASPSIRTIGVGFVTLGALIWPTADLGYELAQASAPSAGSGFYKPLFDQLNARAADAGPAALGERVEVVDPATHWQAAYIASHVSLARGWDRQADREANALFYDGPLTSAGYRRWLSALAVRWVAMPLSVPLDYAARDEAALVRGGLPYLRPVWSNEDWRLYRVVPARPLASGATIVSIDQSGLTFRAPQAGWVTLQMRWSPYLHVSGSPGACLMRRGAWTSVHVPAPGDYTMFASLDLDAGGNTSGC